MNQKLLQDTLEHRLNLLDTYEVIGDETLVYFYTDEVHRDEGPRFTTVTLRVEADAIRVIQSRRLPTRGWRNHAKAIRRADEFVYLIKGTD